MTAPKRRWLRFGLTLAIGITGITLLVGLVGGFLAGRPQWILTAENQAGALRVRMITTDSDLQIYEVLVLGGNLSTAPLRLPATEAEGQAVGGVTTLFMDRTLGPGRWVFKIDAVHFDCQPARIIVNGTEYQPPANVTVNPSQGPPYVPPRGY
jgi:hypothetical protein